ncbi:LysR substrate-binding domain-containing protein [Jannaschia sp. S6380]|uniref:LysR substrate-binding domain-containing protein n=1 Tax=Jannaschia sp. S6380 TaxID=2926408 RepID=UPI001FF2D098|nr:LysR substrate-binding domain-containing protein [Jannaschia sp. S6380]MCK0166730.1 LysR substrate-binding domain-containing protein [Jannaschia sp. S6380]
MRHDLYSLQLFMTVAACGSIAAAASRHNTVASAISKRISDLEAGIGTPVLSRKRHGVELTPAGQDLLRHAQAVQDAVRRMEADLSRHAAGLRGAIRIAANTSAITQFLPEDLAAFVADHSDLAIELVELTSDAALAAVRSGQADLGIYSGLSDAGDLRICPYRSDTLVVAAHRGHRLALRRRVRFADVLDEDFVALQQGSSIQAHLERQAARHGDKLRTRVQVMSFDGVRRMVQARLGIAILPFGAVEPYLEGSNLAMIPIDEPWARRELRIAIRDPELLTIQARTLLQVLTGTEDARPSVRQPAPRQGNVTLAAPRSALSPEGKEPCR